jgi:hypothetical protein
MTAMAQPDPANERAWRLLTEHAGTLRAWSDEPPLRLIERDRQIVRLMANLLLTTMGRAEDPDASEHRKPLPAAGLARNKEVSPSERP